MPVITKLDKATHARCQCHNRECAELNSHPNVCRNRATYAVYSATLCTACMRFHRFPTEGEGE